MREEILCFIDIETTGLRPFEQELLEVALVKVIERHTEEGITHEIVEEWQEKIKPAQLDNADPTALKIVGYNEEEWKDARPAADVLAEFRHKIEHMDKDEFGDLKINKAIIVGHNVNFDLLFLAYAFHKAGSGYHLNKRVIDTYTIAHSKLRDKVENLRLGTLCDHFGIKNNQAHRALSDTKATYELYKKLMGV